MPRFSTVRRRKTMRRFKRKFSRKSWNKSTNSVGRRPEVIRSKTIDSRIGSDVVILNPWRRVMKPTFAPEMVFQMKYSDIERNCTVTTGGIVNASFLYRLNDIFDPYYSTGGGGPAENYTAIAGLYQRYIVWSVDMHIRFYDPSQNTLLAGVLLQCADDTDDPSAKTADYMLQRRNYATVPLPSTTGQGSYREIQAHVKLWELEGLPFRQYVDQLSVYGASFGADPAKSPLIRIGCADLDGQNTGSVKVQVSLIFHGKAYGPKQS